MGFYREQILPRLTDLALRGKEAAQLRARAAGLGGEVVEVGLGSGLTMPCYPPAVTRLGAIVVARVISPREAQAYGLAFSEALAAVHAAGLPIAVPPATILFSDNRPC